MSYISKKEKVFDLPDQEDGSCISLVKGSEHRLKIFPSVGERGATFEECQKIQQLYGVLNGKESNISKTPGFKYIPIDVLLTILMAEKDAYIQELLERQEKCSCGDGLFKANRFDDSEDDKDALIRKDAEVVALKNRNAVLESEIEECRGTLTKAMHKLEDVEEILNENIHLREKIKCSDEMIKFLEENKRALELELHNREIQKIGRTADGESGIPIPELWAESDRNIIQGLCNERDILKSEIEILQKDLMKARASLQEMDSIKNESEALLRAFQEISKENECFKKKLEGMKKLEKFVEELKKQALKLTEKYERESHRANEQMKQLNIFSKELQILRDEREALHQKIVELTPLEVENYCIKNQLAQVELIIEEKNALNKKLTHLDNLETENEHLRSEIEALKNINRDLNDNKKKVIHLEYELEAQEDQIKALTSQIQILTQDQEECNRLRTEIQEKTDVIVMKEEQLKEIPSLKFEIEQLRDKLQKCTDDILLYSKTSKQLEHELEIYKNKCRELEETSLLNPFVKEPFIGMRYEEEIVFAEELLAVQELENEPCPVLQLINFREGKEEDETLKLNGESKGDCLGNTKLMDQDLNEILERMTKFKELLSLKDERIRHLESDLTELKDSLSDCKKCQELKNHSTNLQNDIITLQHEKHLLECKLSSKLEEEIRIEKLEQTLALQKKAVERYKEMLEEMEEKLKSERENRKVTESLSKMTKEEVLLSKKELCTRYMTEIDNLKKDINHHKKLVVELREENKTLHKLRVFTEFTGKKALENVLSKLKAELVVLQGLSKPELESECQVLHAEVKRLIEEAGVLKVSLEAEKKSKDLLEKKLSLIQRELMTATRARHRLSSVQTQTSSEDCFDQSEEIKKTLHDIQILKAENEEFVRKIAVLQNQCKDFEEEVENLHDDLDEISRNYREERHITTQQKDDINAMNERIKEYEKKMNELQLENGDLNNKLVALREELTVKEAEIEQMRKELTDVKNEMIKLNMEMEAFQSKESKKVLEEPKENDGKNENSEAIVIKVEKEFEELRRKLEICSTTEEKLLVLRTKRDNLIVKVNCFESEVDFLKKKLIECDVMKAELEQLKAEKKNCQMTAESEEKLLSDIFGLKEQLKLQQKEIEHARTENANLKEQLQQLGKLLEVCKKGHKTNNNPLKADIGITTSNLSVNDSAWDRTARVDSSTSCEKLCNTISVDEFRTEIAKMESKHKLKIQKLKDSNAEKIRKLMEQYEKESKNRNKAYNDSLNNIKSNYESDIRKLVERHKSSILRLQNLHEDEIQELNTNYETQMEAMQTLNENVVNDLTSGAVEKWKLTERYNKEVKDIEAKFQKLLKEKENQHMTEIANLQEDMKRNINELKELHKEDLDNLNRLYEENISQIEEKHNKELKKCKKNNFKRTELVKLKYEDLLTEERKKYEEQLQIMLERLKMGQVHGQNQEDIKFVYMKHKSTPRSETTEFNKILQKILSDGLESLKFDELMLIHCKTCFTTENFFDELNIKMGREGDLIGDGCPHIPLLKEDKKQLLNRILILEKEIAIKQLETHEAIINMERAEKCRIEELNTLLRNERDKNAELKLILTSQTRAQTDLKIESYMLDREASLHETNFIEKVKELEVERAEKRRLEEELQKERNNSKHLTLLFENERQRFKSQRKKDSEYVEAMRMRLEEALSHEQIMESQLDYEAQFRTKLEFELQSLQRSFNLIVDQPQAVSLESKMVKVIKNLDRFESEREEKLSNKSRNKVKSHNPS